MAYNIKDNSICKSANKLLQNIWADRYLWLFASIAVFMFYNLYLGAHFSPDTWSTAEYFREIDSANHDLATKWSLLYVPFAEQGRFVRGFLMFLLGVPNKSSLMVSNFANAVALVLFVFSIVFACKTLVATVNSRCKNYNLKNYKSLQTICFLAVVIAFCNPFFCDWLQFAECALLYPLGLLFSVLATRVLIAKWPIAVRLFLSAVFAILSAGIYQIALQYFVLLCMLSVVLFSVLGENAKNPISMAKNAIIYCLQAMFAYVLAVLSQYFFTQIVYQSARMSTDYASAINMIVNAQTELWNMQYLGAPTSIFKNLVVALAIICILVFAIAIHKKCLSPMALAVCFVTGFAFYASIFVMMLIAEGSIPHRTVVGFFGIPLFLTVCICSCLAIIPIGNILKSAVKLATLCAISIVLVYCLYNNQKISLQFLRSNTQDIALAQQIQQSIALYEKETETKVEYVAFHPMPGQLACYSGIFQSHDINLRAWVATWSRLPLLNTVNNTNYELSQMPEEIINEYFASKEWETFSSEQVVCINNTAYVALY